MPEHALLAAKLQVASPLRGAGLAAATYLEPCTKQMAIFHSFQDAEKMKRALGALAVKNPLRLAADLRVHSTKNTKPFFLGFVGSVVIKAAQADGKLTR